MLSNHLLGGYLEISTLAFFSQWALICHVHIHFILLSMLLSSLFLACSVKNDELLRVRQFKLKESEVDKDNSQMVRGEQLYILKGAVTQAERKEKLGEYYTIRWQLPKESDTSGGEKKVIMDYQQSATAAEKLQLSRDLPRGETKGRVEFHITGEAYRTKGRILAWRVRLMDGVNVIDEKRSYLWR
ncbi:MAG: hypothetical protein ACSHX0_07090 [Akkermansiaceae bacterium]